MNKGPPKVTVLELLVSRRKRTPRMYVNNDYDNNNNKCVKTALTLSM